MDHLIGKMDWQVPIKVTFADDIPEKLDSNIFYIIGSNSCKWLGLLICPCGCSNIIQLNLLKESKPCWKVIRHRNNSVTLRPSIRRVVGCRSHFCIKKGKILWVLEDF